MRAIVLSLQRGNGKWPIGVIGEKMADAFIAGKIQGKKAVRVDLLTDGSIDIHFADGYIRRMPCLTEADGITVVEAQDSASEVASRGAKVRADLMIGPREPAVAKYQPVPESQNKLARGDHETFLPKTDTNDTRVDEQRELALEARTDHVAAIFRDAIADYFRATGWGRVCAQPIGNGDFRVTACGIKGVELAWVKVYSGASDDWMRVEAAKMREAINSKIPMPAPTGLAPADSSQRGRPWGL